MPFLKLIILSLIITSQSFAQTNLIKFTAEQIESIVYINWTFNKGFVCTGTSVKRSSDNYNFYRIGQIEGICGSFDEPIEFDFTDSNPLPNQINYYRLKLGSSGFSDTLAIQYVKFNEYNYSISPNPVVNTSNLFYENKENNLIKLLIYNQQGQLIREKESTSKQFVLQKSDFQSGLYFFHLCSEDKDCLTGRFLVF